jgi:hypothetical protein
VDLYLSNEKSFSYEQLDHVRRTPLVQVGGRKISGKP